jgi:hypothetical protein
MDEKKPPNSVVNDFLDLNPLHKAQQKVAASEIIGRVGLGLVGLAAKSLASGAKKVADYALKKAGQDDRWI